MSVSERDRRDLHEALVGHIGEREAGVLMDLLPRDGWDDVVRQGELDALGGALRLEMQAGEARLSASFHRDMVRQTWIFAGTVIAAAGTLGGLLR